MLRFVELGALLEPGRPPKTDKAAILVDAVRIVTQLRTETQKLKDSNLSLQEKIKELKVRIYFFFCRFQVFDSYQCLHSLLSAFANPGFELARTENCNFCGN